ncbi:MAG: hypothetical protein QXO32_07760 [Candidatus Bathyarchaeia archaeon]
MGGIRIGRGGGRMRLLGNVRFMNRKAVSGVISGMFAVLIFFVAIAAIYSYHVMQDRYLQTVNERHQMDWERLNERIIIPWIERREDGTLNATVRNIGAVAAHLVSLWLSAYDGSNNPQWQRQYAIGVWVSPGEARTNLGQDDYSYTLIKPGQDGETLTFIQLPYSGWTYTIKVVTERGNVAIAQYPSPVAPSAGGGGGGYPIVIVADHYNFQYAAGSEMEFKSAYEKPWKTENTLYRILLNNTTNKRIILHENCSMLQSYGAPGQFKIRYIVSNQSTVNGLVSFDSQTMNPGGSQYIYYAATTPKGTIFQSEPNSEGYYPVGFLICFKYEGESEVRTISLPVIIQHLTK